MPRPAVESPPQFVGEGERPKDFGLTAVPAKNVAKAATELQKEIAAFPGIARAWLSLCAATVVGSWWKTPTHLGLALVFWSLIRAFCVPRRSLLIEACGIAGVSVGVGCNAGMGCLVTIAGLGLLHAAVLRMRPEVGIQRLVGFDRCHLLLTSDIRASTTHHFLEFAAPFERALVVRALTELIDDVDRLRSFVREAPLGIERFVTPYLWVDPATLVEWHDDVIDPTDVNWFDRPIDVTSQPPVRLFHALRRDGGCLFGLTLHHSAADATGAMALLDGFLRRYDRLRGVDVHVLPILSDGPRCRSLVWRHGLRSVLRMFAIAARRKTRLVRSASLVVDDTPRPASSGHSAVDIPIALWRAIAATAATGCTPNHLLMAASLRATDQLRRARGLPDEAFRVVVPSDLRTLYALPRSLPNYTGAVLLETTSTDVRAQTLALHIRERVRAGRAPEEQMCFPVQIGLLGLLPPRVARRILRNFDQDPRTFAFSFLFSHIRVPRDLHMPKGNPIARFWCASSQGRQPAFGVTVTTIDERTWALLQYLTPYVASDSVKQFSIEFLTQLEVLATARTTPEPNGIPCA